MIANTIEKLFVMDEYPSNLEKLLAGTHSKTSQRTTIKELLPNFIDQEIPEFPESLEEYLKKLQQKILPHVVKVDDSKFVGHMTSALPNFHSYISQLMVALNQNLVKIETSHILTFLEKQCVAMLHKKFFQLTDHFYDEFAQNSECVLGSVIANGSAANISALWAARNSRLETSEVNCKQHGVFACLQHHGYSNMVVIASELAHYSLEKFASLSGLGANNILRIKTKQGKIDIGELLKTIEHCQQQRIFIIAIVGVAGTTEIGSIDDLPKIASIAKEFGVHFHVDAAWGGPLIFSRKHKNKLLGIEQADSITICGHKQLYLPQGVSLILYKSPHLAKTIATETRYQARQGSYDLGRWTFEGSRPAVCLHLHAALFCIGERGYEYLLEHGIAIARHFADKIREHSCFELLYEPQSNIVSYRYLPEYHSDPQYINAINTKLQRHLYYQGKSFVSHTTLPPQNGQNLGTVALRAVFANPKTTIEDLDEILSEQIHYGKYLEQSSQAKIDA